MNLMLNGIDAINEVNAQGTSRSSRNGIPMARCFSVSDTGIGLPPEGADKVFETFFHEKPQGTGMGLR